MIIPIPSAQQRFRLRFGIRAWAPFDLGVCGFDPTRENSDYIRRRIPFHAGGLYREFTLPFPLSPKSLLIDLHDKYTGDDRGFTIEKCELEKMPPAELWAEPEMHRFVDFAQNFSQQAGYLPAGAYDSPDGEFLIQYLPIIENEWGPMVTPARTNRFTGRIQASRSAFRKYTIPIRLVVLLHERHHYQIPTRLEKPSDLNAIRVYLDLGFPRTEAVYAVSKIFLAHPDTVGPAHATRVKDVIEFIDRYSQLHHLTVN
jgi:hypothetical protein